MIVVRNQYTPANFIYARRRFIVTALSATMAVVMLFHAEAVSAAEKPQLYVGTATADITPSGPVATCGMFELRLSKTVETPLLANVIVLESRQGEKSLDYALLIACDLAYISDDVFRMVCEGVKRQLPDLDPKKIILSATHTHTAPVIKLGEFILPKHGVVQIEDYLTFMSRRVADAVVRAWRGRACGSATWGLGHAVVARNRRTIYADGSAVMLGGANRPDFRGLEGYEDHAVDTLFLWNAAGEAVGMAIDVPCPAQMVCTRSTVINADFWHPVREALKKKYGEKLCVVGLVGAAGDQCPAQGVFIRHGQKAEERMLRLRKTDHMGELARRIVRAVGDTYDVVKSERRSNITLVHKVERVELPMRVVTKAEYDKAKSVCDEYERKIAKDPKASDKHYRRMKWYKVTVERFERQKTDPEPKYPVELHVLRIGDAVICTNPFELYTEYGIRIKARSPAEQTFVVQLAGQFAWYLPTAEAVRGGGYSTEVESNMVGPEGGQALVDKTVEMIQEAMGSEQ